MPDDGAAARPRIQLLSLGGTIAMTADGGGGVTPRLQGGDLVAAVPQLATVADVEAGSFRTVPGAHLSFDDVAELARHVDEQLTGGVDGIVVTQGTDTLEETAFLLDLLLHGDRPVVMTGAMRNPTLPGADGPANVLAAVRVAASPAARGRGVLVVLDDAIHAARFVSKRHTQSTAAFVSLPGPLGWVAEDAVRILLAPPPREPLGALAGTQRVALLAVALEDDGALLRAALDGGCDGIVVAALGGGHVPAALVEDIERAAARVPVVLSSRTGGGETLRGTYGFPGSETDLLGRGVIGGGWLDGPKARVLLTALLRSGLDRDAIAAAFERFLTATPPPAAPAAPAAPDLALGGPRARGDGGASRER